MIKGENSQQACSPPALFVWCNYIVHLQVSSPWCKVSIMTVISSIFLWVMLWWKEEEVTRVPWETSGWDRIGPSESGLVQIACQNSKAASGFRDTGQNALHTLKDYMITVTQRLLKDIYSTWQTSSLWIIRSVRNWAGLFYTSLPYALSSTLKWKKENHP